MSISDFVNNPSPLVYIVMGIDEHEHDQVLGVFENYKGAKQYCTQSLMFSDFHDIWIEKHPILSA